jgi:hypothetical protein
VTVYVDDAHIAARVGRLTSTWCHLWADTPDELHAFAALIGMKRAWYQGPPRHPIWHYDLTAPKRVLAVRKGAVEVEAGDLSTHPAARQYGGGLHG